MDKRTFLKLWSSVVAGSFFHPPFPITLDDIGSNWAGNYHYQAETLHEPKSLTRVQELVRKSSNVHILGTRHSFNSIADTSEDLISLQNIEPEIVLDRDAETMTVSAGLQYGTVAPILHVKGYALHNLASLPHISVAGACATATHGSGMQNGNLATAVSEINLLTGNGDLITLTREDGDAFFGTVVGLGGLGVVTTLTLDVQPTFDVEQYVYRDLSADPLSGHFEEIMSSAYSVSFFTDYRDRSINQVWIKNRLDTGESFAADPTLFDAELASKHLHPIAELSAENCTPQMGEPGPWHERLPHFRMDFAPSSGDELQTEYFVPLEHASEAIDAMFEISDQISPHLLISEIRTVAEDNLWMSPAYNQPSVTIHFTWKPDWDSVKKVLPIIEERLAPYGVRPHWGKLFTLSPDILQSRIERLDDFRQLAREYDPEGKFRNDFLDDYVF